MKNFLLSLLIFLIWAFLGMWWYYSCPMCNSKTTEVLPKVEKKDTSVTKIEYLAPFTNIQLKNENDSIIFNFTKSLEIAKESNLVQIPSESIQLKDSIFNYLNTHQNQELEIIGWFTKEEHTSDSLNPGELRALSLKDSLSKFGVNPDKIFTKGLEKLYKYSKSGTYKGGIEFLFKKISDSHLAEIDKGITQKILYSHFNQREFKPDNTLEAYALELKNYLEKHPNEKVTIVGHTDSTGEESDNEVIARDRATNVMKYLIKQGISPDKLSVNSLGETSPIATNDTKEGRAKNRRIEIKVN